MRTANVTVLLLIVLVVSAALAGADKRIVLPPGANAAGAIPADFEADVQEALDNIRALLTAMWERK